MNYIPLILNTIKQSTFNRFMIPAYILRVGHCFKHFCLIHHLYWCCKWLYNVWLQWLSVYWFFWPQMIMVKIINFDLFCGLCLGEFFEGGHEHITNVMIDTFEWCQNVAGLSWIDSDGAVYHLACNWVRCPRQNH